MKSQMLLLSLVFTACLEPHGTELTYNKGSNRSGSLSQGSFKLITGADEIIKDESIIYLDQSTDELSVIHKDGSHQQLSGDSFSAAKTHDLMADQTLFYADAKSNLISMNDKLISVKAASDANITQMKVNLSLDYVELRMFGAGQFAFNISGNLYFLSADSGEYALKEDNYVSHVDSIVECESGCKVWTIKNGDLIYKGEDDSWKTAEASNVDVGSISYKKLAGKLSVSDGVAKFDSFYYVDNSLSLYKYEKPSVIQDFEDEQQVDESQEENLEGFDRVLALSNKYGCIRCHGAKNYDTEDGWESDKNSISNRIAASNTTNQMPPSYDSQSPEMSDEDRAFLEEYLGSL